MYPSGSSVFNCHNARGVKLLARLRLGLSHLCKHKFKCGFQDSLNSIWSCGNDIKTSADFLFHYPYNSNERSSFLNTIRNINRNIIDKMMTLFDDSQNACILNSSIKYILISEKCSGHLFQMKIEEKYLLLSFVVIIFSILLNLILSTLERVA